FIRKIERAYAARQHLMQSNETTAFRLIASESDGLPGITIDMYEDILVVQLLSAGAEKHKSKIIWALEKCFPQARIYERSDVAVREKEGLGQHKGPIKGDSFEPVVIQENKLKIEINVSEGHKTGFYLDQRDSRLLSSKFMNDADVLNCFSYTGTFGLYAIKNGANHVTNVDVSASALKQAEKNYVLNECDLEKVSFVDQDVFTFLRDQVKNGAQYGHVILDPPKFVDSKASLKRAARGYKDINLYGLKCIKSGGYLSTFSCSGLMTSDLFSKIVADAALDAGREVRIIHRYYQAPDHAVASNFPEGFYLKGLLCQVF
ncbi:MAG: class I SAM-dependent methyltransferase, partial [Pseudomonadota bacterium]